MHQKALCYWQDSNLCPNCSNPCSTSQTVYSVVHNGMQLKFSLHHVLQHAVIDEGKHIEACNNLCPVAEHDEPPRGLKWEIYGKYVHMIKCLLEDAIM